MPSRRTEHIQGRTHTRRQARRRTPMGDRMRRSVNAEGAVVYEPIWVKLLRMFMVFVLVFGTTLHFEYQIAYAAEEPPAGSITNITIEPDIMQGILIDQRAGEQQFKALATWVEPNEDGTQVITHEGTEAMDVTELLDWTLTSQDPAVSVDDLATMDEKGLFKAKGVADGTVEVSYQIKDDKKSLLNPEAFPNEKLEPAEAYHFFVTLANQVEPSFNINFQPNGAEGNAFDMQTTEGKLIIPHNTEWQRENFEFTGWNEAADGSGTGYQPDDVIEPTADMVLYAQWQETAVPEKTYTVTYHANGGGDPAMEPSSASVAEGSTEVTIEVKANEFSAPSVEEGQAPFSFKEWNTAADGSGTSYQAGTSTIAVDQFAATDTGGNIDLYAQWQAEKLPYSYVQSITIGPEPDKEEFAAPDPDSAFPGLYRLILPGTEEATYNFVAHVVVVPDSSNIENTVMLTCTPDQSLSALTSNPEEFPLGPLNDLEWSLDNVQAATSTEQGASGEGGEGGAEQGGESGGTAYGATIDPVTGVLTIQQNTQARVVCKSLQGQHQNDTDEETVEAGELFVSNIKKESSDPYKITYDSNGGEGTMEPTEADPETGTATVAECTFIGPARAAGGDNQAANQDENANADQSGESSDSAGAGGVDSSDGVQGAESSGSEGGSGTAAAAQFKEWNTKPDGTGTPHLPGEAIELTEDITLYAQWEEAEIKEVTYDANKGKGEMKPTPVNLQGKTRIADNDFEAPEVEEGAEPLIFKEWNTKADGTGDAYKANEEYEISESLVLYAQWGESDNPKIIYDANQGTGKMSPTVSNDEGKAKIARSTFTPPEGKGFNVWNTKADGSGDSYSPGDEIDFTKRTGEDVDLTLYAQWEEGLTPDGSVQVGISPTFVAKGDWARLSAIFDEKALEGAVFGLFWHVSDDGSNWTSVDTMDSSLLRMDETALYVDVHTVDETLGKYFRVKLVARFYLEDGTSKVEEALSAPVKMRVGDKKVSLSYVPTAYGETATFSATYSNIEGASFIWYVQEGLGSPWQPIPGVTGSTYSVMTDESNTGKKYAVRLVPAASVDEEASKATAYDSGDPYCSNVCQLVAVEPGEYIDEDEKNREEESTGGGEDGEGGGDGDGTEDYTGGNPGGSEGEEDIPWEEEYPPYEEEVPSYDIPDDAIEQIDTEGVAHIENEDGTTTDITPIDNIVTEEDYGTAEPQPNTIIANNKVAREITGDFTQDVEKATETQPGSKWRSVEVMPDQQTIDKVLSDNPYARFAIPFGGGCLAAGGVESFISYRRQRRPSFVVFK